MPELPEVETIRAGLARWVTGRTIASVEIYHPRAVRRHTAGGADFAGRLAGQRIAAVSRRGKYLWLPIAGDDLCIVVHLGMSGQLLVHDGDVPDERHLRVRLRLARERGGDAARQLRFVDQRTFGGLLLDRLVPAVDAPGQRLPSAVAHIGRDPLDPRFDQVRVSRALRRRNSAVKRVLLDQSLVSGIGNIYVDEALWRARLHGERVSARLRVAQVDALFGAVRAVLGDALAAGGTSFDALYVNVNGRSGYFDRELAVYGRTGQACRRCGAAIRRSRFMNRSSFYCPRCQLPPRAGRGGQSR